MAARGDPPGSARGPAELADAVRAGRKRRVIAPGGMGKTHLLDLMADRLGHDSVIRWNAVIDPLPPEPGDAVVLADNVHDADVDAVRTLARSPAGAVLAHRPVDGALAHLLDAIDGSPHIVEPLGPDELRGLLAAQAPDETPPSEYIDGVQAYTAGIPRLVVLSRPGDPTAPFAATWALEQTVRAELRRFSPPAVALLSASAVLDGVDLAILADTCDLDLATAATAVGEIAAAGLALDGTGRLVPAVAEAALRTVAPPQQRRFIDRAARRVLAEKGDVAAVAAVADRIRALGLGGPDAAYCLISAARAARPESPDTALIEVVRGCNVSGADRAAVDALISFDRHDAAATVAAVDSLLAESQGGTFSRLGREAIAAAAVVLARRGAWAQCAELASMCVPGDAGADLAVLGRVMIGQVDEARQALTSLEHEPPAGIDAAARLGMARGLVASVTDDSSDALPQLLEAARLQDLARSRGSHAGGSAALAAVVACHLCEFEVAAGLVTDTRRGKHGIGHRTKDVLSGWLAMRRDDGPTALAHAERARARSAGDSRITLATLAIDAGVARRRGDLEAMMRAWRQARALLLTVPPDLLLVQPTGELLIAGARLGDRATVRSSLASIQQLLARAGDPPLWTLWARWDELHMTIALDDLPGAKAAAKAAAALPCMGARTAAIAEAAVCWVDALGGHPNPDRVRAAARGLADAGLSWEAARLAGGAAIRTPDSAQMRSLLQFARDLRARPTPAVQGGTTVLSAREREVAGHLLAGMTYREIGAQLFIAPKTVEHHVARMRRRLGVETRSEMMLALRRYVRVAA